MVGKLSKIATGQLYTHVSNSRVDVDFMADVAESCGIPEAKVTALRKAVNAHHFLRILGTDKITEICDKLCLLAAQRCRDHTGGAFEMECVMTDYNGTILGRANVKG